MQITLEQLKKLEKVCNFSREENIYRNKEGELFICSERMKERINKRLNEL